MSETSNYPKHLIQGRLKHRDHRDRGLGVFWQESPCHKLSEEKKILKIGLKLAEIEAKMHLMRGCLGLNFDTLKISTMKPLEM